MNDESKGNHDRNATEMLFSVDSQSGLHTELPWYQTHLDILLPLLIFGIGLFQFVLRKWILPVPKDVIEKLENQFPSQGLLYMPEFGIFFIILSIILFILFNFM